MIVGWDLDGVLCQQDLALLKHLENDPGGILRYYRTRQPLLNPALWMHPDDIGIIITHRKLWTREVTRDWLRSARLSMPVEFSRAAMGDPEHPWDPESAAEAKARYLRSWMVDVYVDDDPDEVEALRRRLDRCKVLRFGGSV